MNVPLSTLCYYNKIKDTGKVLYGLINVASITTLSIKHLLNVVGDYESRISELEKQVEKLKNSLTKTERVRSNDKRGNQDSEYVS